MFYLFIIIIYLLFLAIIVNNGSCSISRRQIQHNREGDLLDEQDTNRQAGRIIDKEVDLIIELDTRHQAGLNIDREGNLLTKLVISRQAGRVTK